MERVPFACTGIILLLMGGAEILYVVLTRDAVKKIVIKIFIFLYGLLLVAMGFSIFTLHGSYKGHELILSVLALLVAGPAVIIFPVWPRRFLLSMMRGIRTELLRTLIVIEALLCFITGSALLYFSFPPF